jgi:hypothetical protein
VKRFITILIGCCLAFTAGARAEQADPKKKQKSKPVQKQQSPPQQQPQHQQPQHQQPQHQQPQHQQPQHQQQPQQHLQQHAVTNTHVPGPHPQHAPNPYNPKIQSNDLSKQQVHTPPNVQSNKLHPVQTNKVPVQSDTLPAVQSNRVPGMQTNKVPAVQTNRVPGVQANPQSVQRIQSQHVNFHARPSTTVNSVQFNQNYRINGSENWHGQHYDVFRTYHPQWHDRGWWHSHHNHLVLIGGGWYFWNAGYWFPAWGYDSAAAYYPYDGPIYVGSNPRPFDQVVADAQSVLQEQGYYHGEVDGLVGPLTREALAEYQSAQGLEATAAIDQPTLESLGLG